jgi:hypothetical protein
MSQHEMVLRTVLVWAIITLTPPLFLGSI